MSDGLDSPLAPGQCIYWRERPVGETPSSDPRVRRSYIKQLAGDNIVGLVENPLYSQDLAFYDLGRIEILRVEPAD